MHDSDSVASCTVLGRICHTDGCSIAFNLLAFFLNRKEFIMYKGVRGIYTTKYEVALDTSLRKRDEEGLGVHSKRNRHPNSSR